MEKGARGYVSGRQGKQENGKVQEAGSMVFKVGGPRGKSFVRGVMGKVRVCSRRMTLLRIKS